MWKSFSPLVNTAQPIDDMSVWQSADLNSNDDWIYHLNAAMKQELHGALQVALAAQMAPADVTRNGFPLGELALILGEMSKQLECGRGIALLRGIEVERYSRREIELIYTGIGTYLGTHVAQSRAGDVVGTVTDTGKRLGEARGTKTRDALPFHSDRCDVVALFCLQAAKRGGESYVVSATTAHNVLLAEDPLLCAALYEPIYHRRTDWEALAEDPVYSLPIFSVCEGHFAVRYLRHFIKTAQELPSTPRITARQFQALDRLDAICADPQYCASIPFQAGDIQFLNNFVALHSRAGYEDYEQVERRRLLLRLWLSVPNSRPLVDSFSALYGQTAAGELRGGVAAEPKVSINPDH